MNRKKVYDLLLSVKEISRAEISRRTNISAPTVLKIIDFFIEKDIVTEIGEGISKLGRKPLILRFNPEAAYSIGVEFEGDFYKIGIVDLAGNIKYNERFRANNEYNKIIREELDIQILNLIQKSNIDMGKICGVGIGIPGAVDNVNYKIDFAPLVGITSGEDFKPIIEALQNKIKLPIFIENDTNAAAIGEFVARKLPNNADLIYISIGTGLGSGVILDGKLRRGKRNSAGEIGYMVFDKEYHTYKSKPGWLESHINLRALSEKWEIYQSIESVEKLKEFKNSKDFILLLDRVASYLGMGIVNIANFLDIQQVVIGGMITDIFGQPLIDSINEYISKLKLLDITCELKSCKEPGIIGAASISTKHNLKNIL